MGGDDKGQWWEQCLGGLSPEVAKERRRVLMLLEAHKENFRTKGREQKPLDQQSPAERIAGIDWVASTYNRLMNLVANGVDLDEEMQLPPEERAGGFNWPDE